MIKRLFVLSSLILLSIACLSSAPKPTGTPTLDVPATQTLESQMLQATQDTLDAQEATQEAQLSIQATHQAATQAVVIKNTAMASDLADEVIKLLNNNKISSSEGQYYLLEDFDKSWAQINWYQWWETGFDPSNFVIRSEIAWETASRTANWDSSGCGFVFREKDQNNHYFIFLALDGNVYLKSYKNGNLVELGKGWVGHPDLPKGQATMTMAVDQDWITVMTNGKQVLRVKDKSFTTGKLALTLVSGTNKDFGTRCQMTNLELWVLE